MTALETEVESKLRKMVKRHGGKCVKWVCPGWTGVPDRIVFMPGGRVYFVETKRPKGGKYSAMQDKWRDWLHELGAQYYRIKDDEGIATFELIITN